MGGFAITSTLLYKGALKVLVTHANDELTNHSSSCVLRVHKLSIVGPLSAPTRFNCFANFVFLFSLFNLNMIILFALFLFRCLVFII